MTNKYPLCLIVLLCACGGGALTAGGAKVKLMKMDPDPKCEEIGGVTGRAIGPDHVERSKNMMRNDAAEKGANYIRLESLNTQDGYASGTAFKCPE